MCVFDHDASHGIAGEKGFEPLTYGFGDHCSTFGTILPREHTSVCVILIQMHENKMVAFVLLQKQHSVCCVQTQMEFAPIFIYLIVSIVLSCILVGVPHLLVSSSSNLAYPEKLSAYECGFDPFDDARSRFDIRFYLVSILFIIFDLEVTFLFPWAVSLNKIGYFGFWSMMVFLFILTIGFVYEWKKGALDWE